MEIIQELNMNLNISVCFRNFSEDYKYFSSLYMSHSDSFSPLEENKNNKNLLY